MPLFFKIFFRSIFFNYFSYEFAIVSYEFAIELIIFTAGTEPNKVNQQV